jgi:hypothetical protein
MFVIVDTQTIFHTEYVGMLMIPLHTKFHMLGSTGSLVTGNKRKANYRYSAATILLFYTQQQKKKYLTEVSYFLKTYYQHNTSES